MTLKIIRFIIFCVLCFTYSEVSAQDEYVAEIGLTGGDAYYLGDANNQLFKNNRLAYGAFFRYRFNTRIALRAELNRAKIVWEGNATGNQVNALDACAEFNFFDLDQNPNKRMSKTFSPYIFAGLGLMNYLYTGNITFNASIPFGVGLKVKLTNRLNMNIQWSNRLSMSDQMEGISSLNNNYNLNGSNFTNNDLLSTFTIGIGYDIWRKQCDCKNSGNK
ncbi:MAG: DUF6089 family protein [Paludibacter sp.]